MWRCGAVPQIEVGKGDAVGGVADCRAVQDKSALSFREGRFLLSCAASGPKCREERLGSAAREETLGRPGRVSDRSIEGATGAAERPSRAA